MRRTGDRERYGVKTQQNYFGLNKREEMGRLTLFVSLADYRFRKQKADPAVSSFMWGHQCCFSCNPLDDSNEWPAFSNSSNEYKASSHQFQLTDLGPFHASRSLYHSRSCFAHIFHFTVQQSLYWIDTLLRRLISKTSNNAPRSAQAFGPHVHSPKDQCQLTVEEKASDEGWCQYHERWARLNWVAVGNKHIDPDISFA